MSYNRVVNEPLPWRPTEETPVSEIARVNFSSDLYLYASGFRDGAEALLKVTDSSDYSPDLLVYPIMYSLRHSVELLLKQVIRTGRILIDEPDSFPDGHRLNNLWNTCRPILTRVWPTDPSYELADCTIRDLCRLDPEGEGFRYPVGTKKQGKRSPTLPEELRIFDLGALARDALQLIDFLLGMDAGIDEYLGHRQDMQEEGRIVDAEMRREHETDMRGDW